MVLPRADDFTREKVELGKRLFFDPILSLHRDISCASCHQPELAFSDGLRQAKGLGQLDRNTPSLINVGFLHKGILWDGSIPDLESQVLHSVRNPLEMGLSWPAACHRITGKKDYKKSFRKIYGDESLDSVMVASVLAHFQRTLIGNRSRYDQVMAGKGSFTPAEKRGWTIFFDADPKLPSGECAHCHTDPLFTDGSFQNNGLVSSRDMKDVRVDPGRSQYTGNLNDRFLFKVPSLRNVAITAPYMHDGRMKTLREVLLHYNMGGNPGYNVSPNVRPLKFSDADMDDLTAFLHTLTDAEYLKSKSQLKWQFPR